MLLASACGRILVDTAPEETIVFSSARDGNIDLYLGSLDGTRLRRLTDDPAPDQFPRCSPDGRHIVFVRDEGDSAELYRLDRISGREVRLTENSVKDGTPNWSADGRHIYLTQSGDAHDRIAVVEKDGLGFRYLTDGAAHDTMPGASPDGRWLIHHIYRYGRDTELQIIDLQSGSSRRFTVLPGSDYEAAFAAPRRVVFSSNIGSAYYRIYAKAFQGGKLDMIADTGENAWGARYSSGQARSCSTVALVARGV